MRKGIFDPLDKEDKVHLNYICMHDLENFKTPRHP